MIVGKKRFIKKRNSHLGSTPVNDLNQADENPVHALLTKKILRRQSIANINLLQYGERAQKLFGKSKIWISLASVVMWFC